MCLAGILIVAIRRYAFATLVAYYEIYDIRAANNQLTTLRCRICSDSEIAILCVGIFG